MQEEKFKSGAQRLRRARSQKVPQKQGAVQKEAKILNIFCDISIIKGQRMLHKTTEKWTLVRISPSKCELKLTVDVFIWFHTILRFVNELEYGRKKTSDVT